MEAATPISHLADHALDASGVSPLLCTLRLARRRWTTALFLDTLTVALLGSGLIFAAGRLLGVSSGETTLWIALLALAVSTAVAITCRPSLMDVAARLDAGGDVAELFCSALLLGNSTDAWSRLLIHQAELHIGAAVARQRWQRLTSSARSSTALAAAAITFGTLLIPPSPGRDAAESTAADTAAISEKAASAEWFVPPPVRPPDDEPNEPGRSVPVQTEASGNRRPKNAENNATGDGQADSQVMNPLRLTGDAVQSAASDTTQSGGNGTASIEQGQLSASGGRVADLKSPAAGTIGDMSGLPSAPQGLAKADRPIEARYRALARAYFAR